MQWQSARLHEVRIDRRAEGGKDARDADESVDEWIVVRSVGAIVVLHHDLRDL